MIENASKTGNPSKMKQAQKLVDALDKLMDIKPMDKMSEEEKNLYYAETLAMFTKTPSGNALELVKIKGSGYGYYYSMSDKKLILVPREAEYYLVSNKKDSKGRLKVYSHYKFNSGVVLLVHESEIERLGWN